MTVCKLIEDDSNIDPRVEGNWIAPWEITVDQPNLQGQTVAVVTPITPPPSTAIFMDPLAVMPEVSRRIRRSSKRRRGSRHL